MRFIDKEVNPDSLSPLNLAFIGDCVYEMFVRENIVLSANRPVKDLHRESVKFVCAKAQTEAYFKIKDLLTEKEEAVFKRGRNAKSATVPKNADVSEYRRATGFEALIGYLYLKNDTDRLLYIMNKAYETVNN